MSPFTEELSSPGGGVVIPESLKGFLEEIGPDAFQVVTQEVAKAKALLVCKFSWNEVRKIRKPQKGMNSTRLSES
jgi:hypothetical protein